MTDRVWKIFVGSRPHCVGGQSRPEGPSREPLNCGSQLPCSVLETYLRAKSQELRATLKSPWPPEANIK